MEPELLTTRSTGCSSSSFGPQDAEQAWGAGIESSRSLILQCALQPPGGAVEEEIKQVLESILILNQIG